MEITDYEVAKKVIDHCLTEEFVDEDDVPDDEEGFIEKAQELYETALDARDNHDADTEDILGVIKLAETPAKGSKKPAAKKAKAKSAPEPEEAEEEADEEDDDSEAVEEPWEDYDKDKIADIVSAINIWGEDGDLESISGLLEYESQGKNRKKIVEAAEGFLSDDEPDEDDDEDAEAEEPDTDEEEDDAEEESESEVDGDGEELVEPYEGYDDSSVKDIKEGLTEFSVDEDTSAEDLADTLAGVIEYEEASEKPRVSIIKHAQKILDSLEDEDGDEEESEAEEEGEEETEESAAPAAKSSGSRGSKGSKADRGSVEVSTAIGVASVEPGEDAEYDGLIDFVREEIEKENLHVPAAIESDQVEVPFDLNDLSEAELSGLHAAFGAYAYRTSYLLTEHESIQSKCRQAADEIVEAILAHGDESHTLSHAKAVAEQNEDVKKWRLRQRHHGILADAMRRRRDDYREQVALFSRQITARNDQWLHAGNGNTESVAKAPAKSKPMLGAKKPMRRK